MRLKYLYIYILTAKMHRTFDSEMWGSFTVDYYAVQDAQILGIT